jgi:hypothetical protein
MRAAWALALLSGLSVCAWADVEDVIFDETRQDDDGERTACAWWDGHERADPLGCSTLAASRISRAEVASARARALECALAADVECVLSTELNVAVPSAFVYAEDGGGMQMLIAPRVLNRSDATDRVEVRHPRTNAPVAWLDMAVDVTIEYLAGGSRQLKTRTLQGEQARCVQALRLAISDACWSALD